MPVVLVTGTFDILRAEHVRELAAIREKNAGASIVATIIPGGREWLPTHARAELVAAMRMIDYVVIAASREAEDWIALLRPAAVMRFEAADARRAQELIEHVQQRQSS